MDQPWKEYATPDGRKYWHNGKTSTWTKPEALMTPAERALAESSWKEYTAEGGRKYWHDTQTKQTTWEMPQVFKDVQQAQAAEPPQRPPPPSFVAGGGSSFQYSAAPQRDESRGYDRNQNITPHEAPRQNFVMAEPANDEPEYATFEEAEAAFLKMLKRTGVQPNWNWQQVMKTTITDPQYRALKDPKERKVAFDKFVAEAEAQDKEREKERMEKIREDFTKMLKSHPEIKRYTRWKTARPIIEGETIFRSARDDTERRQLYEEYIISLKKANAENEAAQRKAALDEMTTVLSELELEPYSRWSDAQEMINNNQRFDNDDKFRTLSKADVLTAFQNHIKGLERSFNDQRQSHKLQKARRERINRDKYTSLLRDLKAAGKIKAGTRWMDVQPLIEDDERYTAMLGQSGSTPLDLFWDACEEEERVLRKKRNEVLDVLDDLRFEMTSKTGFDEFESTMQKDPRTSVMDTEDLKLIFNRLHEKVSRREEEEKTREERRQRHAIDALRSRLKRLDPPIRLTDTWEEVQPRIEKYHEYRALETDDLRRAAFDKFLRRLKERETEDRDQDGRRDRRDRERSHRHRSGRSPERDAYEADRKKAQAARERQYRKASSSGFSPRTPPLARQDRDEHYDSRHSRRVGSYGRDLDVDRERGYMNRADPRDPGAAGELDYGESGMAGSTSSGRRRRESEDVDGDVGRRESKRMRKERDRDVRDGRSRTPKEPTPAVEKIEENYKSGSEEGEIEEA